MHVTTALDSIRLRFQNQRLTYSQKYVGRHLHRYKTKFPQELYAASLLSVLAHAAAKISVALFVLAINARRDLKLVCFAVLGIIVAWAVSSVFVIAFRCSLPTPWRGGANSCMDSFLVYLGINIVNIATDLALIVVPTVMMWKVQTGLDVRVQIISLFASRILLVAL